MKYEQTVSIAADRRSPVAWRQRGLALAIVLMGLGGCAGSGSPPVEVNEAALRSPRSHRR